MAKDFAMPFYKSKRWQDTRAAYISHRIGVDGGLCEDCHKESGMILHHIISLTPTNINSAWISTGYDNLMYVCKECHDSYEGHGVNNKVYIDFTFDADGQPIPKV